MYYQKPLHEQTIEHEEVKLQIKETLKTKKIAMAGTLNETVEKLESYIEKEKINTETLVPKTLFNNTHVLSKEQAEPTAIKK